MSLDSRLAQLSDPNTSAKKKRQIMDQLQEETGATKDNIYKSLGLNILGGGLAAVLGGAAGRRLVKNADPMSPAGMGAMVTQVASAFNPLPGVRRAANDMVSELEPKLKMDNINLFRGREGPLKTRAKDYAQETFEKTLDASDDTLKQIVPDLGTTLGATLGTGLYSGLGQPIVSNFTKEQTPTAGGSVDILEKIQNGTATREERALYKDFYREAQDSKGSKLAQYAAALGVGIPAALLLGGKTANRLGDMARIGHGKDKFFRTKGGRNLALETGLDAVVAGGLGGAAGSLAYNATSDPYTDPF